MVARNTQSTVISYSHYDRGEDSAAEGNRRGAHFLYTLGWDLISFLHMPEMKSFGRFHRLLLPVVLGCCCLSAAAQNGSLLGRSITWKRVQSPFTPAPSNGAIAGGPGSDPNPGTPMFICRAQIEGSLVPGKWVQGNCNVPYGGAEQIMRSYEVAYGSARGGNIRVASMVLRRQEATRTETRSIHAAFTTLPHREPITVTSPASWSPTGRAISRWAEARSWRVRLLKCSMLPVADGRRTLIRRTLIRRRIHTRCSRRNRIHRAGPAIQR